MIPEQSCPKASHSKDSYSEVRSLVIITLVGIVVIFVGYFIVEKTLIVAAYEQRAPGIFNNIINNADNGPIEYYFRRGRIFASRVAFVYLAFCICFAIFRVKEVKDRLRLFFYEQDSPINLAVLRIATFAVVFRMTSPDTCKFYAELPTELLISPGYGGMALNLFPFQPDFVLGMAYALQCVCVFGMLGIGSRTSATIAFLLGFYVLGVPQCFGKVNHYHHVLWVLALLAASPSGDALSFDSLWKSQGTLRTRLLGPGASVAYGRPLRFVWILIGIIYFFPGFWKLWNCGIDWGLAENLRLQLYHKWASLGHWRPVFRVDQYDWFLSLAGLGTIIFEIGFVMMMFSKKTRVIAAVSGLMFHNMTNMFMSISFWNLQIIYVAFIPWDKLFQVRNHTVTHKTHGLRSMTAVGSILLILNVYFGVSHKLDDWPFACYPTFDFFYSNERGELEIVGVTENEIEVVLTRSEVITKYLSPERFDGLSRSILSANDQLNQHLGGTLFADFVAKKYMENSESELTHLLIFERIYEVDLDSPRYGQGGKSLIFEKRFSEWQSKILNDSDTE